MSSQKVQIIAEAGVNHNGSISLAKELIDAAASAGADIVKFQTFKAKNIVTKSAKKADYQISATGNNQSQFEMLKSLELSYEEFLELSSYCSSKKIEFLSTAFDIESLDFLVTQAKIKRIKVPSGEMTNGPLLLAYAKTKLPLIVSTGMCDFNEIEQALDLLVYGRLLNDSIRSLKDFRNFFSKQQIKPQDVSLLHCTTEYPAPFEELNLKVIESMSAKFGLPVGLSDHSQGVIAPIVAVSLGATIIEKHFTLDRNLKGPDHKASLNPEELNQMVRDIRLTEKILGTSKKAATQSETGNSKIARRSVTSATVIRAGDRFTEKNITCKRPGTGISAMYFWDVLSKNASKDYLPDELIDESIEVKS